MTIELIPVRIIKDMGQFRVGQLAYLPHPLAEMLVLTGIAKMCVLGPTEYK